jgi:hypothetical protein
MHHADFLNNCPKVFMIHGIVQLSSEGRWLDDKLNQDVASYLTREIVFGETR